MFRCDMFLKSVNRTSNVDETPSIAIDTSKKVNVDVLKQRLVEQKKKDRIKKTIIFSTVFVSLGAISLLTY
ncbi:MAG: hypothetical protein CBC76_00155 [Flavobacteriaceae bacterium TMED116]|nr:MAG: hypothetical protein CBC76_00155 [Flavobacteriaceae bacterium TMED116]